MIPNPILAPAPPRPLAGRGVADRGAGPAGEGPRPHRTEGTGHRRGGAPRCPCSSTACCPARPTSTPATPAPIYLRTRYQTPDTLWAEINPTYLKWRDLPLDKFPAAEARKFVTSSPGSSSRSRSRRAQACTWDYTVPEQRAAT